MALQSLDIKARSATTTESPSVRRTEKVAKLIDISKCIGCKACEAACMEWNDLRDDIGDNNGDFDSPRGLSDRSWTVMNFYEEEPNGKFEWLIRKDGCVHCADPGCLAAPFTDVGVGGYRDDAELRAPFRRPTHGRCARLDGRYQAIGKGEECIGRYN